MSNHDRLVAAAVALGPSLRGKVVFVGGCTVHLYLDDGQNRVDVRPTEDVDVIVEVLRVMDWYQIEQEIRELGFSQSMVDDDHMTRYRKDSVIVDFMPTDESILGFTNRWYSESIQTANHINLVSSIGIRYIQLEYFLLTKFAAFDGRGNGDLISSKDIEDIIMIFAGRENIERELMAISEDIKAPLVHHLSALRNHRDFSYAVSGCFPQSQVTADLAKTRINNSIMFLEIM